MLLPCWPGVYYVHIKIKKVHNSQVFLSIYIYVHTIMLRRSFFILTLFVVKFFNVNPAKGEVLLSF